jgi:hypothetical protein
MVDDWLGCPWVGLHRLLEFGYQETRSELYFLFVFSVDSSASIYQRSASVLVTPLQTCRQWWAAVFFPNQTGLFLSFPTLVFIHIENRDKWSFLKSIAVVHFESTSMNVLIMQGVQFHPESIITTEGRLMVNNFIKIIEGYEASNCSPWFI